MKLYSMMAMAVLAGGILPEGKKYVFTTRWDDSHPEHPRMAEMLESIGAKGTFYYNGRPSGQSAADMKELAARGHGIGVHTVSHAFLGRLMPQTQFREILESRILNELASQSGCYAFTLPFSSAASEVEPRSSARVDEAARNAGLLGGPERAPWLVRANDTNPDEALYLKNLASATNAIAAGRMEVGPKVTLGVHNWSKDEGRARLREIVRPFATSPEVVCMNENEYLVRYLKPERQEFFFPHRIVRLENGMKYDSTDSTLSAVFAPGEMLSDLEFRLRLPVGFEPGVRIERRETVAADGQVRLQWKLAWPTERELAEGNFFCALETNARDAGGQPVRFWQVFEMPASTGVRPVPSVWAEAWDAGVTNWVKSARREGSADYAITGVRGKATGQRFRFAFRADATAHGAEWRIVFAAKTVKKSDVKALLNGCEVKLSEPFVPVSGVNTLEISYMTANPNYSHLAEIAIRAEKDGANAEFTAYTL